MKMRKRGSITAETMHKIAQIPKIIIPSSESRAKRKESISLGTMESMGRPQTYLTVPNNGGSSAIVGTNSSNVGGGGGGGASTGGFRAAFTRFVSGSWAGWGSKNRESMKRWQSESIYSKQEGGLGIELPGLSVCADVAKIDRNKLAQTEFHISEFDGETFQLLIEYLHAGTCPLSCECIPGLICAAEHFDIPDLLQACVHHVKAHIQLQSVPQMLCQLEPYYWRYNSAMQLVNALFKYIDPRAARLFTRSEFLRLSESMLMSILSRQTAILSESLRFQAIARWSQFHVQPSADVQQLSVWHPAEVLDQFSDTQRVEFRQTMDRLACDVKLRRIPPYDLIRLVLPCKVWTNQVIVDTLLLQADAGVFSHPELALVKKK
jgi:hypothetical protein